MRFGASRSQLYDAQKTARAKWTDVQTIWDDEQQQEFGEAVWEPLDRQVSDVLRAVDLLSVMFTQVRHECEFQP